MVATLGSVVLVDSLKVGVAIEILHREAFPLLPLKRIAELDEFDLRQMQFDAMAERRDPLQDGRCPVSMLIAAVLRFRLERGFCLESGVLIDHPYTGSCDSDRSCGRRTALDLPRCLHCTQGVERLSQHSSSKQRRLQSLRPNLKICNWSV